MIERAMAAIRVIEKFLPVKFCTEPRKRHCACESSLWRVSDSPRRLRCIATGCIATGACHRRLPEVCGAMPRR
jgi:hypothetical protein